MSTTTFGGDATTALPDAVKEAADALAEGEYTDVIEANNSYYVAHLISEFDQEATDKRRKAEIVSKRQTEHYDRDIPKTRQDAGCETLSVNEKVWKKVTLDAPLTITTNQTVDLSTEQTTDGSDEQRQRTRRQRTVRARMQKQRTRQTAQRLKMQMLARMQKVQPRREQMPEQPTTQMQPMRRQPTMQITQKQSKYRNRDNMGRSRLWSAFSNEIILFGWN